MKNEESEKLMLLQQRFKDVYEALLWLNQNKEMFRAPVHPPMLLLLKVSNEENRKYILNTVFERDLIAFLCEDKEDGKLLTRIFREEKNLEVNIVVAPDKPIEFYQSPPLSTELRQLGIKYFLKDIVDAPDAVMRFLCHCCHIHVIPVCALSSEEYISDILEKFKVFFTPDEKFKMKLSKYSQNRSIRRDPVKSDNLLLSFKDHSDQLLLLQDKSEKEQEKLNELNENLQKLENKLGEIEKEESALKDIKRISHEELQKIESIERQLQLKSQLYDRKKNEIIDEEIDKVKMIDTVQQISRIVIGNSAEIIEHMQHFYSLKLERLKYNLRARVHHKFLTNHKKLIEEKAVEFEATCKELDEILKKRKEIKSKALLLIDEGKVPRELSSEQKLMYNTLIRMSSKEDIEREIHRIEAILMLDSETNAEVITEYYKRKERIESIQREIENRENELKEMKRKMNAKKREWFPSLTRHIKNINSKFSRYYNQLNGCSGEITIDDANDSDDFLNYGLQILLKYRDEENLEELSIAHHSGGECSVATIIFILSLQELTEVPFRCIDEINQGMDIQNERNIYNLIADCAKSSSHSQYFLLTPKLLPDLEMIENSNVAVHIIFNSLFLRMKLDVQSNIELDE